MWLKTISLIIALSCLACDRRLAHSEQRAEVLRLDPAFAASLKRRDEIADRIRVLEHELALKQDQVDERREALNDELDAAEDDAHRRVRETETLLEPQRAAVQRAIDLASEEYKQKQQQREHVTRAISRARKSLKSASAHASAADRLQLDQELATLIEDARRLDQELLILHRHSELLRTKLELLRL